MPLKRVSRSILVPEYLDVEDDRARQTNQVEMDETMGEDTVVPAYRHRIGNCSVGRARTLISDVTEDKNSNSTEGGAVVSVYAWLG